MPYLADMVTLEWAWHVAYHAEDAAPLPLGDLARAVEHAEDAALSLHPSLGVVRSSHRLDLRAQHPAGEVPATGLEGGEDALVVRPKLEVEVRRLPRGGASFILALRETKALGEAAAIAANEVPGFELETNL